VQVHTSSDIDEQDREREVLACLTAINLAVIELLLVLFPSPP
jgi:hypothetical protein